MKKITGGDKSRVSILKGGLLSFLSNDLRDKVTLSHSRQMLIEIYFKTM